jgi:hypothetical protein
MGTARVARIKDGKLLLKGEFTEGASSCSLSSEGDLGVEEMVEGLESSLNATGELRMQEFVEGYSFEE